MRKLKGLKNVLLFITNRCNLKCSYCYVRQGGDVMPFAVARQVIDNIDDGTVVDFFGGEALLELPLLHAIVDYSIGQGRKLVFQLFSNGTRYDDEVRRLLAKGVNIGISFDGLAMEERTHDEELSKLILANAKALKKDRPGMGVKVAITPRNVSRLVENVKYLSAEGFNFISHFLLREDVWDQGAIASLKSQTEKLMDWYCLHINEVKLDHFDGYLLGGKRRTGCWAGCDGVAVGFGGELYPCQRFLTNGSPFVIGTVDSGITNRRFQRVDIAQMVGCSGCSIFKRCSNICIAAQWENGGLLKPIAGVCAVTKVLFDAAKKLETHRSFIEERLLRIHAGR
ncbi:MAG: radical SAM protein [Negativicutes bacterium]|nr:radical SAM protein [Negativicutes bacterium]